MGRVHRRDGKPKKTFTRGAPEPAQEEGMVHDEQKDKKEEDLIPVREEHPSYKGRIGEASNDHGDRENDQGIEPECERPDPESCTGRLCIRRGVCAVWRGRRRRGFHPMTMGYPGPARRAEIHIFPVKASAAPWAENYIGWRGIIIYL